MTLDDNLCITHFHKIFLLEQARDKKRIRTASLHQFEVSVIRQCRETHNTTYTFKTYCTEYINSYITVSYLLSLIIVHTTKRTIISVNISILLCLFLCTHFNLLRKSVKSSSCLFQFFLFLFTLTITHP